MCIWKKIYDPEKLVWPPDPREAFYLTILQAELRVTTLLTTLCIDGWGASGGGLTDLILRCWSIGKSKPFKEIISPFHRRLLLNLRLWNGVWLWRISGVTNRRWRSWFSPKIQYIRVHRLCIRAIRVREANNQVSV